MLRYLLTAAAAVALSAVLPGSGVQAQSRCADEYVVQPGDTLYQVTQQCRVRLSALLRANPQISDIHDIPVGMRLTIPGSDGGRDEAPERGPAHEIAPGDTLFSLAEQYGVNVDALLKANPGIETDDLEIGLTIRIPGSAPDSGDGVDPIAGDPTINVQPLAGGPGAPITVSGENYTPGRTVEIGVGPPQSEWRSLDRVRVRPNGEVEAHVAIPESARPGRQVVFVIHTDTGRTQVSQPVDVVANRDPDRPGDGDQARTEVGRLTEGTECPVLRTPDGRTYSLSGVDPQFDTGDYVRVRGRTAEISFCMEGEATIEVEQMTRAQPPRG